MVAQLGIVHPPVPFFVNIGADQAGLIPQYTECFTIQRTFYGSSALTQDQVLLTINMMSSK